METLNYKKAVIYCRVSSEKQVREGSGLESQEHRCREYARTLGLEVEEVFKDEGISGGLFDRPAIMSLLKFLDDNWQNKYCVIFDDLKRFARDVEVHIKLKSELMAREAQLRCLNYSFDDSAEGEFVETIFAAQNQLERKQNRRQVCQKMKARLERGYWCFYPPCGYEYKKNKEHGKLIVPIRSITNVLAEGLDGFAENRLLNQVDFLNFLKSKNFHALIGRKPNQLNFDYAKRLLTQPLYAGVIEFGDWDVPRRRGHHKAIISVETFEKIQAKLVRPERKPRVTDNVEFPLRRLVSCSVCGKNMTSGINKGKYKYYPHYTCNNKDCTANPKHIAPDKLESDYIKLLESIKAEPEFLKIGEIITQRKWDENVQSLNISYEVKEAKRKELEQMIKDYINLMPTTQSASLRARYQVKIEELDKEVSELNEDPETKKLPDIQEALKLVFRFIGTPAETWRKASPEAKILLHNMIFTENPRYSMATGFGTPKLSLPFSIKQFFFDSETKLVDQTGLEPATSSVQTRRSTR
jgi:site-specific DNA recombinase